MQAIVIPIIGDITLLCALLIDLIIGICHIDQLGDGNLFFDGKRNNIAHQVGQSFWNWSSK